VKEPRRDDELTTRAFSKGRLSIKGALARKNHFNDFCWALKQKEWAVNIQPPFAKPEKVLEYLSW
jgi:hypothetical protein